MPTTSRRGRWLRGALLALPGLLALALPAADLSGRVPDPWWGPETLAGDAVVVALAALLIAGGCWLATRDWESRYLTAVVVRTYAVTAAATVLFAWAIVLQLWSVGDPEPYVIALDGVLIAALIAFATAVLNAENARRSEADRRSESESRALAEKVIDRSAAATVVADATGEIVWLNRAAASFFGVERSRAVGRDRDTVIDAALETVPADGEPQHVECRVRPGEGREARWLERRRHGIDEGLHAGGWIEQYTDVTEKREATDALAAREAAIARLAGESADGRFAEPIPGLLDAGRELLDAEYAAFTRLDDGGEIDVVRSERVDPPAGEPAPELHARCRRAVERSGEVRTGTRAAASAVGGFEFDHGAARDGPYESYLGVPVTVDDELVGAVSFLSRTDDGFPAWEQTLAELLSQRVGYEHERERLLTERRASETALEHERERLEFINRIVRHNVLNGLNLLNARSEHLADGVDDPEAAEHLSVIRGRVDDMTDLIDTIRTFMDAALRDGEGALEPVPIRATLEEQLAQAAETYDASLRVHDLPDPDLRVEADGLASELFENVLSNAVEHNDTDEPTVEVWTSRSTERLPPGAEAGHGAAVGRGTPEAVGDGGQRAGEEQTTLTVHVADDGPGIPDEEKRAMLSTGEAALADPGHGFGFYLVREMLESYGGGVRIRDNEPRGTVVDLVFPVAGSASA